MPERLGVHVEADGHRDGNNPCLLVALTLAGVVLPRPGSEPPATDVKAKKKRKKKKNSM